MNRADHEIIQRVLDGSISQKEFAAFQVRLRKDPELAKLYGEYALLNHTLYEEYADKKITTRPGPVSKSSGSRGLLLLASAAVIVLSAAWFYQKIEGGATFSAIAKSHFSEDAVWRIEGASRTAGDSLELGKGTILRLTEGTAELSVGPAATAVIEGPSTLTVVSGETLRLEDGRGRFHLAKGGGKLEVVTPSMSAVDLGTEFGIEARPGKSDELHVFTGKVEMRVNGRHETTILSEGEGARVAGDDGIERFPADENHFTKGLIHFETLLGGPFVKDDWRQDYGYFSISGDRIEGENYAVFRKLPRPEPDGGRDVLLVSLDVVEPAKGRFLTDGWAGMSFFSKGAEVLFFGDSYGPERTWSLDVKQHIPIIIPSEPVTGARMVTLRYDRKNGGVSLHAGGLPLAPAFCSGTIPPGTVFDEVRLGASSSAALAVRSLVIRVGGENR